MIRQKTGCEASAAITKLENNADWVLHITLSCLILKRQIKIRHKQHELGGFYS